MNQGLFEPTVIFFRMCNALVTFQAMMNHIFKQELWEGWLVIYMDNILVATQNNLTFHQKCIQQVLEKLQQHDLYLQLAKCTFEKSQVEYLEVVLEGGQIKMDPGKVKAVSKWHPPKSVKGVCGFLGFTGFY